MGKRGPAPAPTSLKLVKGTRKDRVNTDEPQPDPTEVVPPSWMSREAKAVWKQYAPDLERQGVLKAWDVEHFAMWCDMAVKRRHASAELDRQGAVVEVPVLSKDGVLVGHKLVRNPNSLILKSLDDSMARYGARFGLTPSDRSQLKVGDGDNKNPKGRLLTS